MKRYKCVHPRLKTACASVQTDQSVMDALWSAKSPTYFQAENSKTDLITRVGGGMIWIFAERTSQLVRYTWCKLILTISMEDLTLKASRKKCIWKCRLLKSSNANNCLALLTYRSKQRRPRTDCSYRSSLIWVHTVCHRGFLNISADEKSRRLLLRLAH